VLGSKALSTINAQEANQTGAIRGHEQTTVGFGQEPGDELALVIRCCDELLRFPQHEVRLGEDRAPQIQQRRCIVFGSAPHGEGHGF